MHPTAWKPKSSPKHAENAPRLAQTASAKNCPFEGWRYALWSMAYPVCMVCNAKGKIVFLHRKGNPAVKRGRKATDLLVGGGRAGEA